MIARLNPKLPADAGANCGAAHSVQLEGIVSFGDMAVHITEASARVHVRARRAMAPASGMESDALMSMASSFAGVLRNVRTLFWGRVIPETYSVPLGEEWPSIRIREDQPDETYRQFEEVYRGSQTLVATRQARFVPAIRRAAERTNGLPVLDAGCGRGEVLGLLREAGIAATGVDINPSSCDALAAQGFDVQLADANEWLRGVPEASLAAVVSNSVIEHMEPDQAIAFFFAAERAIAPGGCLIVETNNPECPIALGQFWLDLTHVRPYHAGTLAFLARGLGMRDVSIVYDAPVARAHRVYGSTPYNYQEYTMVAFKEPSAGADEPV